uniref:Capsid n=1 Tax=viral metagenome TaxID=1070528 RepID=A0A2V0RBK3_9ZZZZ
MKLINFKSNHRRLTISHFRPSPGYRNINRFGMDNQNKDILDPALRRVAEGEFANVRNRVSQNSPRGAKVLDQLSKGDTQGAAQTAVEMGADGAINYASRAAQRLANKAKTRVKTKTSTKQEKPKQPTMTRNRNGNNNGGGRGNKSGRGPSRYSAPSTSPRQDQGYNPFIDPPSSSPIKNSHPEFKSFYHVPLLSQEIREDDGEIVNYAKTAITVINTDVSNLFNIQSPSLTASDLKPLNNAKSRIYTEAKIQAISNTNGGRSASVTFTSDRFYEYLRLGMSACALIANLNALMAWDPPYEESNSCIRSLSNKMSSSIPLRVAKGALEEALAALALPRPMKEYYRELFQIYKTSPIAGGTHHLFCNHQIIRDIKNQSVDFDSTVAHLDNISAQINGSNFNDYAVITALLKDKTYFTYDSMRDLIAMPDSPCYSARQATLFNNTPWYTTTNATPPISLPVFSGGLDSNDTAHLVSAMGVDELTCYEVAPAIQLFGDSTTGSGPVYFAFEFTRDPDLDHSNRFWFKDSNSPLEIELHNVIQSSDDLLDFRVTPQATSIDASSQDYNPIVVAKGENVRLYQASKQPLIEATVNMMYKTMDISSSKLM